MTTKQFCKYTVLFGAVIIETLKWGIRPNFHFSEPTRFLLGIAPNLLGAFLLPLGCYWLLSRYLDLYDDKQLRLFCVTAFVLLMINEVLQLVPVLGRTFDFNDIAASAIGLTSSYFFSSKFLFRKPATYP